MPLTSGTRLGPYEVTTNIAQGRMGEVYKAGSQQHPVQKD